MRFFAAPADTSASASSGLLLIFVDLRVVNNFCKGWSSKCGSRILWKKVHCIYTLFCFVWVKKSFHLIMLIIPNNCKLYYQILLNLPLQHYWTTQEDHLLHSLCYLCYCIWFISIFRPFRQCTLQICGYSHKQTSHESISHKRGPEEAVPNLHFWYMIFLWI